MTIKNAYLVFRCQNCLAFTRAEPHISTAERNFVYTYCPECGVQNWIYAPDIFQELASMLLKGGT